MCGVFEIKQQSKRHESRCYDTDRSVNSDISIMLQVFRGRRDESCHATERVANDSVPPMLMMMLLLLLRSAGGVQGGLGHAQSSEDPLGEKE